jgi:2-amino-4-hydroxy-6-hydroxymethyldihydropteridine diphosphokinase
LTRLVLIIGGNIGDRVFFLERSRELLNKLIGKEILASSIFETEAWGGCSIGAYLNQVLLFDTIFSAEKVLQKIHLVENHLERKRQIKWGDRTMDIDILYFGNSVINTDTLTIPHPYISERRFVLVPLVEVMPDFIHPVYKVSHEALLNTCTDSLEVKIYKKSPDFLGK